MSMATILRRLAAIEARLNIVDDTNDTAWIDDVRTTLALIAERRRAQANWKPHGISVAVLIEAARRAMAAASAA
jgi:hypothetical protein